MRRTLNKKLYISIRKVLKHVLPSPGEQRVHTTESHSHVPALDTGNKGTFVSSIPVIPAFLVDKLIFM
jgi:hypothetical protein